MKRTVCPMLTVRSGPASTLRSIRCTRMVTFISEKAEVSSSSFILPSRTSRSSCTSVSELRIARASSASGARSSRFSMAVSVARRFLIRDCES